VFGGQRHCAERTSDAERVTCLLLVAACWHQPQRSISLRDLRRYSNSEVHIDCSVNADERASMVSGLSGQSPTTTKAWAHLATLRTASQCRYCRACWRRPDDELREGDSNSLRCRHKAAELPTNPPQTPLSLTHYARSPKGFVAILEFLGKSHAAVAAFHIEEMSATEAIYYSGKDHGVPSPHPPPNGKRPQEVP
jgi:hypothetical protein